MGPMAAIYRAMHEAAKAKAEKDGPEKGYHAGLESKIRRATVYLDEGRAFWWEPGGFLTAITTESAEWFELGWRAAQSRDNWREIDQRLAEAYYETQTFADYIGAGIIEEEQRG